MVIAIDAEANETCRPGAFEGVHWARHGTGFVGDISIAGTVYALLTVYVKVQDSQTSQYKLDFFVH